MFKFAIFVAVMAGACLVASYVSFGDRSGGVGPVARNDGVHPHGGSPDNAIQGRGVPSEYQGGYNDLRGGYSQQGLNYNGQSEFRRGFMGSKLGFDHGYDYGHRHAHGRGY